MYRIFLLLFLFVAVQQMSSQDLINKIADDVCDCISSKIAAEPVEDMEQLLVNCINDKVIEFQKLIREDYGDAFFENGNSEVAKDFGIQIGTVLTKDCPVFLELAVNLSKSKETKAEEYYSIAEEKDTEGAYQESIKYYNQAIGLAPGTFKYINSRGVAYYNLGQYYKAISDFFRAREIDPEHHITYYNAAYSMYHLNDINSALEEVDIAISINSNYSESLNLKELIFSKQNLLDSALYYFRKTHEIAPESHIYIYNIGYTYYRKSDYNNALPWFLKCYNIDSSDPSLVSLIGICYNNLGDYEKAIQFHTKLIDGLSDSDYIPYYNRGLAYFNNKDYKNALNDLFMAFAIDSTDVDVVNYITRAYIESENYQEAEIYATKAIEMEPRKADSYDFRGKIYTKLQKFELALKDYHVSLSLYPNDCNIHLLMAEIYARLGMNKELNQSIAKAKAIGCNTDKKSGENN